jgi:hypothetical protein
MSKLEQLVQYMRDKQYLETDIDLIRQENNEADAGSLLACQSFSTE